MSYLMLAALAFTLGYLSGRVDRRDLGAWPRRRPPLRAIEPPDEHCPNCDGRILSHARSGLSYYCGTRKSWAPLPREMFACAQGGRAAGAVDSSSPKQQTNRGSAPKAAGSGSRHGPGPESAA